MRRRFFFSSTHLLHWELFFFFFLQCMPGGGKYSEAVCFNYIEADLKKKMVRKEWS